MINGIWAFGSYVVPDKVSFAMNVRNYGMKFFLIKVLQPVTLDAIAMPVELYNIIALTYDVDLHEMHECT